MVVVTCGDVLERARVSTLRATGSSVPSPFRCSKYYDTWKSGIKVGPESLVGQWPDSLLQNSVTEGVRVRNDTEPKIPKCKEI